MERHTGLTYRRNLPHIVRSDKPLFITYTTAHRWRMPPGARTIGLRHALFEHRRRAFIHVAVIMPDHVHLVLRLINEASLAQMVKSIKGISARRINQLLRREDTVWRDESFDHVVRSAEWSRKKIEYVCNNPVRA